MDTHKDNKKILKWSASIILVVSILGVAIFSYKQYQNHPPFLALTLPQGSSVKVELKSQSGQTELPQDETAKSSDYTFHHAIPDGTYDIYANIQSSGQGRNINIIVNPAKSGIYIKASGFEDYKNWSLLVDDEVFFPNRSFDWSGKAEILIPLYTRPRFTLCFKTQKEDSTGIIQMCHGIVQRIAS